MKYITCLVTFRNHIVIQDVVHLVSRTTHKLFGSVAQKLLDPSDKKDLVENDQVIIVK